MHELAVGEDRDGRRAAAHVDAGGAEFGLVVDQRGKPAGVGRCNHALDRQMRAVDAELEIAERRRVGGHHVHVDAERLAEHAARIVHAALAVERVAGRQRMQDLPLGLERRLAPAASTLLMSAASTSWPPRSIVAEKISLFSRPAEMLTIRLSTVRPAMRSAASTASRTALLGLVQIDDDAGLDAARLLVADADHLDLVRAAAQDRLSSRGFSRAIRQQILVEPTSSTVTIAGAARPDQDSDRRASSYAFPPASSWRLAQLDQRRLAPQRRRGRQLYDQPILEPQVDRGDIARQQPCSRIEAQHLASAAYRPFRAA